MHSKNRLRSRLVLRSVALALLTILTAVPSLRATQSASVSSCSTSSARQAQQRLNAKYAGVLAFAPTQVALPEELGLVFEDSDEMLRGDIQQRKTFGIENGTRRRDLVSKTAPTPRAIISPPLLV